MIENGLIIDGYYPTEKEDEDITYITVSRERLRKLREFFEKAKERDEYSDNLPF